MAPLTGVQVAAAAYIGGFHGDDVAQAVALAKVESGWDPAAVRNDNYGLWQIRKSAHQGLFKDYKWDNPADNGRMANVLFQRRGGLLHPTGGWSDWPAHGGPRFKAALPEGKAAWAELKKRLKAGDSPEKILRAQRSDGRKTPEGGLAGDIGRGIGAVDWGGFLSALSNGNTWLRVTEVVFGALLVIVGLTRLVGASALSATPVGKVAKLL